MPIILYKSKDVYERVACAALCAKEISYLLIKDKEYNVCYWTIVNKNTPPCLVELASKLHPNLEVRHMASHFVSFRK